MELIFDRYGGHPFWARIMDQFYDKNLADPLLSYYYEGKNLMRLKEMNRMLLCACLCSEGAHFPLSVKRAHLHLKINEDQFNRFAMNLVVTLKDNHVNDTDISEIVNIIESFKVDLVHD